MFRPVSGIGIVFNAPGADDVEVIEGIALPVNMFSTMQRRRPFYESVQFTQFFDIQPCRDTDIIQPAFVTANLVGLEVQYFGFIHLWSLPKITRKPASNIYN
jgi:hypothetical protein